MIWGFSRRICLSSASALSPMRPVLSRRNTDQQWRYQLQGQSRREERPVQRLRRVSRRAHPRPWRHFRLIHASYNGKMFLVQRLFYPIYVNPYLNLQIRFLTKYSLLKTSMFSGKAVQILWQDVPFSRCSRYTVHLSKICFLSSSPTPRNLKSSSLLTLTAVLYFFTRAFPFKVLVSINCIIKTYSIHTYPNLTSSSRCET